MLVLRRFRYICLTFFSIYFTITGAENNINLLLTEGPTVSYGPSFSSPAIYCISTVCLTGSTTISIYPAGTVSNFFLILKAKRVNLKMLLSH